MIKVEVILEGGFTHDKVFYGFGDIVTKEDNVAKYFCDAGWCRDLSGNLTTGTLHAENVTLKVENLSQTEVTING